MSSIQHQKFNRISISGEIRLREGKIKFRLSLQIIILMQMLIMAYFLNCEQGILMKCDFFKDVFNSTL